MAERTTKAMCIKAFERLIAHIGGTAYDGVHANRMGKYFLDHDPKYGGYRVGRFTENGESMPFGGQRYGASEFWSAVYMVTHAFEQAELLRKE